MSHEVSETVKDPTSGKWVNVYGRKSKQAGQRLPEDPSGYGHREYDTVDEAVDEAKKRSQIHGLTHRDAPPAGRAASRDLLDDED